MRKMPGRPASVAKDRLPESEQSTVRQGAATDGAKAGSTRRSRSREATRGKLVAAALTVFAAKGIENTTINDITEEADVGFGSFYNHFSSKTEIAICVFEARAEEVAAIGDMIAEREDDAATVVAYVQRVFLTKAVFDPVWAWFIVHATHSLPEMAHVFMMHGKRDIRRGVEQGRFSVSNEETAMRIVLAALQAMMRAILEKEVQPSAVNETIECLLIMLGLSADEARNLSQKDLPDYVSSWFGN